MTPRLASSKSWTDLPAPFLKKTKQVFEAEFSAEASCGEFVVEGRIYPSEVVMRLGYLPAGQLRQVNFEASVDLIKPSTPGETFGLDGGAQSQPRSATLDRIYVCIDALGSVMEDYLDSLSDDDADASADVRVDGESSAGKVIDITTSEPNITIPTTWQVYDFDGEQVYLQYSSVNSRLEDEADRLLGLAAAALVREPSPTDDAFDFADIDDELAFAVQEAIRDGRYTTGDSADPEA